MLCFEHKKRQVLKFAGAMGLVLGLCHQSAGRADPRVQPGFVIEGEQNQPQLSEVPLPTFPYELDEDLPQFDPTSEMLDLLLQPEILADLPVGGLEQEPSR